MARPRQELKQAIIFVTHYELLMCYIITNVNTNYASCKKNFG
jgi:hypothetical protein